MESDRCSTKTHKRMIYITAFAVLQVIVILVFALVFMRVKAPKITIRNVEIRDIATTLNDTSGSFRISIAADVMVKNKNFGKYKYPNSGIQFMYNSYSVGNVTIESRNVGMKSSKTSKVSAELSSEGLSRNAFEAIAGDIGSGSLVLGVQAEVKGKVRLMMGMMKKKKNAIMNCTMAIDLASRMVKSLIC